MGEAMKGAHVLTPDQLKVAKGVLEPSHFLYERNALTRSYFADLFATIDHLTAALAAEQRLREALSKIAHGEVENTAGPDDYGYCLQMFASKALAGGE